MNRAIQDSLMTASMQSLPVKAPKVPRMDEAYVQLISGADRQ